MVWKQLGAVARPADVDDGVQYILQQLMPRPAEGRRAAKLGVIAEYRPDHVSDFNHRPVTFKAFLLAKAALYCRGLCESLGRRAGRELLLVDSGEDSSTWLGLLSGTFDEYPSLADTEAMARLRTALGACAPVAGGEPVLPLFDALAEQFATGSTVSAAAVRKQFGKSQDEADAWMAELRVALRDVTAAGVLAAPVPAEPQPPAAPAADDPWMAELRGAAAGKVLSGEAETAAWFRRLYETPSGRSYRLGGLVLSETEIRAAADALKAAKGNRVLPAFKDAGHRLAAAGKTWYLAFADDVMESYPELRTPVRRHAEGHFGRVKQALIFGLERLLDGSPGEAPAVELSDVPVTEMPSAQMWAELESVLTRFPGFDAGTTEAALAAVRLLVPA